MKRVIITAHADSDIHRGCRVCEKVCPIYAIHVTHRKTAVGGPDCRGRTNYADRCPFHMVIMVKREEPFAVGVDVNRFDATKILALCEKARFRPQQVSCYCAGVRTEEVVAVTLDGVDTPEEVLSHTGIHTGCTIEYIQPILCLLEAAGIQPKPDPNGQQWYGETAVAWAMPERVKQKYASRGFYFDGDWKLLDQAAATNQEIQERR